MIEHTPLDKITKANIDVCTVCNHACSFCSNPDKRTQHSILSLDDFSHIAQDIAQQTSLSELGLSAKGEPLLNKDLPKIIRAAKKILNPSYIYISSNGSLLTPSVLEELIAAGLDSIKISFNAFTRESYAERHGKDDFEIVVKNLLHAIDQKEKLGFKLLLSSVSELSSSEVHKALKGLLGSQRLKKLDAAWRYDYVYTPCFEAPPIPAKLPICFMPFTELYIDANMNLTPCCNDYFGEIALGNLADSSIDTLWNSDTFNALRSQLKERTLPEDHICTKCLSFSARTKDKEDVRIFSSNG